jgi:PAS domain S-box-containing protein
MSRPNIPGIRFRILLLVLLAAIPAAVVMAASSIEHRRRAADGVRRGTMSVVRLAASDHQNVIAHTGRLLEGLAGIDAIRNAHPVDCASILSAVLAGEPLYRNLGVADASGTIVCSAIDLAPGFQASPAGRTAIRAALRRQGLAISEYTTAGTDQQPLIVLARAIPGADADGPTSLPRTPASISDGGRPDSESAGLAVFATVRLDWLNDLAAQIDLPPGSVLTATDQDGTVLVHHPNAREHVGSDVQREPWFRAASGAGGDTSSTSLDADGVERFHVTTPLQSEDGMRYGYASVGVPTSIIYAAQRGTTQRTLIWLMLATFVALAGSWLAADRFITAPLRKLLVTARRLEAGDRSARSGVRDTAGEIGQLARAFDEMADSLQAREEELEASAGALSRQALVFDTVQEGVVITDPAGVIIDWNRGATQIFGYSRDEALGQPLSFCHDPRIGGQRERDIQSAMALEGRWLGEIPFVRSDGTRGVSEAVVVAQRGEGGQVTAHVTVNRDITQRKRAEAALRESELSYRMLFNSLTELVYIQDLDGRFLNVNDAVVDAYGYSREELIGQTPAVLADPERVDLDRVMDAFSRAVAGDLQRFEFWGRRKNGDVFPKDVVLSRATYFGREVVIAVSRDITEQKGAERALRESEEQLRHAQKMEAVGRLAGGIAHDFNNLLMSIRGSVELALLDLPPEDELRQDLEQVQQATDTAASLIRQLLAFSRKQEVKPQKLDVNDLIENTGRLLRRPLGSEIELVSRLQPDLWAVEADASQLEQVVMNLALNARDAMQGGGRIIITTSNATLSDGDPAIPKFVKPGRYVLLEIEDTGTGMDAETQQHVFEPFFTTKEKEKGTGLGLFTVYGTVRGVGGHVWVDSEPGRGTIMRVALPAVERAAQGSRAASGDAEMRGTETVLVVEDEDPIRRLARRMLERMGYTVVEAAGGDEALRLSDEYPGPIHLMLTDVTMPKMNGRELAAEIVERRPDLHVVYMSGYAEEDIRGRGVGSPAGAFLHKPFTAEGLTSTIREALDTRE